MSKPMSTDEDASSCASSDQPADQVSTTEASSFSLEPAALLTEDDPICIVGEIVGGYRLPIHDPHDEYYAYVLVRYDEGFVHVTRAALEPGRNPIWTISRGSLFFLETTARELATKKLRFSVWFKRKDPLRLATLERLLVGQVSIDCATTVLDNLNEQPLEVDVRDDDGMPLEGIDIGKLTLRFRLATVSDQDFVEAFVSESKRRVKSSVSSSTRHSLLQDPRPIAPLVSETDETKMVGVTFVNALSNAFSARNIYHQGEQRIRVKPYPDKDDAEGTTYMSAERIKEESLKASKEWIEAGSGSAAKVYLEILSCHDLPNADVGEAMGNLTDCFICAVFEDAMVQTPVIDDELSPHWLPWTQRAFVFGCKHPASILYMGAFDYELGLGRHEPLGRVAVNISNLQRDTDYVLVYPMHSSSRVTERKVAGSIRIRLRIEYEDERGALLVALGPRPRFHVNVFKEKSLRVVRYTCFGEYGDDNNGEKFDLNIMRSYANEMFEYKDALCYCIRDTLLSVLFWRGQVRLWNSIHLPLHSLLVFCSATFLVEYPHMIPPFFLLSIAWIMLATNTVRRQHPSPWCRCLSFWHYAKLLRHGRSSLSLRQIEPDEGSTEAAAYEAAWTQRLEVDQRFAATKAQLIQEMSDFGNENIHTKQGDLIPLDLFEKLSYYQEMLGKYCKYLRFVKIIATWEESIVSFWVTAIFLVAGIVSLVLPWARILRWTGRVVVWCFLGPHMKILDVILHSTNNNDDEVLANLVDSYRKESQMVRQRRQAAVKLKDIKQILFGKFSTLIPSYNLSRYYDRPLPRSFAKPRRCSPASPLRFAETYVPGQQCFGEIIPRPHQASSQHDQQVSTLLHTLELVQGHVRTLAKSTCRQMPTGQLHRQDEKLPHSIGFEMLHMTGSPKFRALSRMPSSSHFVWPKVTKKTALHSDRGMKVKEQAAGGFRRGSMGARDMEDLKDFFSDGHDTRRNIDSERPASGISVATNGANTDDYDVKHNSHCLCATEQSLVGRQRDLLAGEAENVGQDQPSCQQPMDRDSDDVEVMLCCESPDKDDEDADNGREEEKDEFDKQGLNFLLYFYPSKMKAE